MPIDFPQASNKIPLIIETIPPQYLITTYLKNNWKPILFAGIVVAVSASIYYKLKRKKEKKLEGNQTPKTLYYNLPKKSI